MKVAILSNFTSSFISDNLKKLYGLNTYDYGYNQYAQQLLNSKSNLYSDNPDFTFLILDGNSFIFNKTFEEIKQEFQSLIENFLQYSNGTLVISNILLYNYPNKISDFNTALNSKKIQYELNLFLNKIASEEKRVFILDLVSLSERYGYENIFDNGLWIAAKFRFSAFGLKKISELIYVYFSALTNQTKKCLIVDLDNTIWGGIVGEDGLNIKIGSDNIGLIYTQVQQIIKSIKERGIILCICSKNNEEDVISVFKNNPNLILSYDDFVIKKINWEQKSKNIIDIVKTLNIGEDSCVFVDDSPFERELVKQSCNVIVPNYPEKVDDLVNFWADIVFLYFSKLHFTQEDLEKTVQYQTNIIRENLKQNFVNYEDYLVELKLKLTIKRASNSEITRLAQLTNKTNQFNFTTKRYSEADITKFLSEKNYFLYSIYLKDKFGDYGLIGLIILIEKENKLHIDTFLLSCRVIGRNIEHRIIYELYNIFGKDFIGYYSPTAKNVLIKDKYDELGFTIINDTPELKTYLLDKSPNVNLKIMEAELG